MQKLIPGIIFTFFLHAFLLGADAKLSAPIAEGGIVEVLGQSKGVWYTAVLQYDYSVLKTITIKAYQPGLASFKNVDLTVPWGDNGQYLKAAIINNKLSIIYAVYQGAVPRNAFVHNEGTGNIPLIYRQDYDLTTLQKAGSAVKLFSDAKDGFSGSETDFAISDDKSKTGIIIKSRREEKKCKVIVYDNTDGELYNKVISFQAEEKMVHVPLFKVSNDGNALVMAKSIDGTWHLSNMRSGGAVSYYFAAVNDKGASIKNLKIASPVNGKDGYTTDPVANWLNNGNIAIAYGIYKTKTGPEEGAMNLLLYDQDLKQLLQKSYSADEKLVAQANEIDKAKEGFNNLNFNEILPLTAGNFILITEYYRQKKESGNNYEHIYTYRHYAIIYKLNDKLDIANTAFISKKQFGEDIMDFMFSVKANHKGDDAYLVYNESFESKPVDGLQLYCLHLPANNGQAETKKLVRTNDNYFTSIDAMITGEDGKFLAPALKFKGFYTGGAKGLKFVEVNVP